MTITFDVVGKPEPQGSKRGFNRGGRVVLVESARNVGSWRQLVAEVAQGYAPQRPIDTAVRVDIHFRLPVPKSAPKRTRLFAVKKPDLDKLTRAVFDALTGVMYRDDSQIVHMSVTKQLAYDLPIGCSITVRALDDHAQTTKGESAHG